jgi:hypothetical protein
LWTSVRDNFVVSELLRVKDLAVNVVKYQKNLDPYRNPRTFWKKVVDWQSAMDVGLPDEVVEQGYDMLQVLDRVKKHTVELEKEMKRVVSTMKLRVIGDGRLPLLDEYLLYHLKKSKEETLLLCVTAPSMLLELDRRHLLQEMLESHHYWAQTRSFYHRGEDEIDPLLEFIADLEPSDDEDEHTSYTHSQETTSTKSVISQPKQDLVPKADTTVEEINIASGVPPPGTDTENNKSDAAAPQPGDGSWNPLLPSAVPTDS